MNRVDSGLKLTFGYTVSRQKIPTWLDPLLQEVVECYRRHHADLVSVYVVGSAGHGDMKVGISDLDVIGITAEPVSDDFDLARRTDLDKIGEAHKLITFVDNSAISEREIVSNASDSKVEGYLSKITTTGVCVWGKKIDLGFYEQSVDHIVFGRVDRADALMNKYRSGNIIEAFRRDDRLLARSCAKAAMRVLSSMTVLRGAKFQVSPYKVACEVDIWVPEAVGIKDDAMNIIDNPEVPSGEAMQVADSAIELFRNIFPEAPSY